MATIRNNRLTYTLTLKEELIDKYGKAKVGRWCKAPDVPDRCEFCPLSDIKPAVGFLVENGWRYGFCTHHAGKGDYGSTME